MSNKRWFPTNGSVLIPFFKKGIRKTSRTTLKNKRSTLGLDQCKNQPSHVVPERDHSIYFPTQARDDMATDVMYFY